MSENAPRKVHIGRNDRSWPQAVCGFAHPAASARIVGHGDYWSHPPEERCAVCERRRKRYYPTASGKLSNVRPSDIP